MKNEKKKSMSCFTIVVIAICVFAGLAKLSNKSNGTSSYVSQNKSSANEVKEEKHREKRLSYQEIKEKEIDDLIIEYKNANGIEEKERVNKKIADSVFAKCDNEIGSFTITCNDSLIMYFDKPLFAKLSTKLEGVFHNAKGLDVRIKRTYVKDNQVVKTIVASVIRGSETKQYQIYDVRVDGEQIYYDYESVKQ